MATQGTTTPVKIIALIGLFLSAILSAAVVIQIILNDETPGNGDNGDTLIQGVVAVSFGNGTVQSAYWNVTQGTNAYAVFSASWDLTVRNYGSMGVYVEGIEGVMEALPDFYWQFWVKKNSSDALEYSSAGISGHVVEQDDLLGLSYGDLNADEFTGFWMLLTN